MLSFVNITLCLSSVSNTSALSYSSNVNIGFIFNPTISLSISPDNLIISNLTPGTAAESNTITVNVATNTAYGYHLTANVGSNTTNYNTTDLVHTSSATATPASNATFASLAYGSSVSNKDNLSANTWGYSYSDDSGATWRSYSGLPLYSDTNHSTDLTSTYTAADSKSIAFKIAAKASETQPSGDYTNIINFYATSVPEPPLLYDVVEDMTKGTLAENNVKLSDTITQANSGVYTYDPEVYGVASDASNDYNIYFYRGILDTDAGLGTYGSDGQADAWPNYVKLGNDTCWRIVRTTGSGGVKMIYSGKWTGSTCANAQGNAQVTAKAFNSSYYSAVYVGYTYNSNKASSTSVESVDDVFGSNAHLELNNTRSTIKAYIEDTWYASNMTAYTSILEPSAGYCNDRTVYNTSGTLLSEITPQQNVQVNFGNLVRNATDNASGPTLICPRGDVDIYRYVTSSQTGYASNELKYPAALLTVDESVFAGSGRYSGNPTTYGANSYLRSGDPFWFLSPARRGSGGYASEFLLNSGGSLDYDYTRDNSFGVRPAISLTHSAAITSGSGTATSPWTIE